jgi:hypothetical protein
VAAGFVSAAPAGAAPVAAGCLVPPDSDASPFVDAAASGSSLRDLSATFGWDAVPGIVRPTRRESDRATPVADHSVGPRWADACACRVATAAADGGTSDVWLDVPEAEVDASSGAA